ncbi:MAG: hypothetical protein AB7U18_15495 [Dehalococcoidia bacterium]
MGTAAVVLIVGVLGLALAVFLLLREPDGRIRLAALVGAAGGFLLALLFALAFGQGGLEAVATATLGAAVLALALVVQWRFFRTLFARHGGKL